MAVTMMRVRDAAETPHTVRALGPIMRRVSERHSLLTMVVLSGEFGFQGAFRRDRTRPDATAEASDATTSEDATEGHKTTIAMAPGSRRARPITMDRQAALAHV